MSVQEHTPKITLSGDIDLSSSSALAQLEKQVTGRDHIVFDVTDLRHIDSTFLRFLVRLRTHVEKDQARTVELIGVKPHLRRILEITGLARMFSLR